MKIWDKLFPVQHTATREKLVIRPAKLLPNGDIAEEISQTIYRKGPPMGRDYWHPLKWLKRKFMR